MVMAGADRLRSALHAVVGKKGLLLHPSQVAFALLRWHRLTDGAEMLQHGDLALHFQLRRFGEGFLDLGCEAVRLSQQPFDFGIFRGDAAAPLLAARSGDRKSTRLNSSHVSESRMPSSALN